ncbi:transcription factor SCREAM2-like [Nicotiana tabacum]|uniref:Transcription factor SCREAM2-like n=2 Tax=Nicotiana TaxID=4085 RepID=A0A1S3Y7F3_TOBAC|nr:PREDICTED: transcription factor SCREAM2 [Nicotiana sylvestris]
MVSREQKRAAALHEKLQLLRSITKSHAISETSIIVDASKYIQELKHKVERLNHDITTTTTTQSSTNNTSSWPQVEVETLEKGFLVNVYSERSCPGLLVSILEVVEELGLNVLEARVSCTDTFRLEAFSGENEENEETINAQVVAEAVFEAIKNWRESNEQG